MPTAWRLIFGRSWAAVREAIASPQKALTRILTPAAAIIAITAGRRDLRTPWRRLKFLYFR